MQFLKDGHAFYFGVPFLLWSMLNSVCWRILLQNVLCVTWINMGRVHVWIKFCWERSCRDQDIDISIMTNEKAGFRKISQSGTFVMLCVLYVQPSQLNPRL